jgi:hypothetical protein
MSISKQDYEHYFKPLADKMDLIHAIASAPHTCFHSDELAVMKHVINNELPEMKEHISNVKNNIANVRDDVDIIKKKVINGNIKKELEEALESKLNGYVERNNIHKLRADKLEKERAESWKNIRTSWWSDLTVPKKIGIISAGITFIITFQALISQILILLGNLIQAIPK